MTAHAVVVVLSLSYLFRFGKEDDNFLEDVRNFFLDVEGRFIKELADEVFTWFAPVPTVFGAEYLEDPKLKREGERKRLNVFLKNNRYFNLSRDFRNKYNLYKKVSRWGIRSAWVIVLEALLAACAYFFILFLEKGEWVTNNPMWCAVGAVPMLVLVAAGFALVAYKDRLKTGLRSIRDEYHGL